MSTFISIYTSPYSGKHLKQLAIIIKNVQSTVEIFKCSVEIFKCSKNSRNIGKMFEAYANIAIDIEKELK